MLIPPHAALALATALASTPTVPLAPGTRETFAIQPEEGRRHQVFLEAGQFLQATVHQRGTDLVLRLLAPDGSVIEDAVDASEGPSGREGASILARDTGTYVIEVYLPGLRASGGYEVRERLLEHERALAALRASDTRSATAARPVPQRLAQIQSEVIEAGTALLEFSLGEERGHAWVVGQDRLDVYELPARKRVEGAVAVVRSALSARPSSGAPDRAAARQVAGRAPAPRGIAVIADPVYDVADGRLGRAAGARLGDARFARATRDFGFVDGRLPRLPFTRREALAIEALSPAPGRIALDFSANLDAALDADLASYRYVHFAAHGLLNDQRPELSGLMLSLVGADGTPRPGLLTAPDVSSTRLGADLVVLSSCRSAAGREVRGEGFVGLARAFMQAGAPRVVASLWPVDDVASAELMTAMYRGMLGPAKLTPAAALRRAQTAMLRHRKWKAPYYWAGFQLQGEWR